MPPDSSPTSPKHGAALIVTLLVLVLLVVIVTGFLSTTRVEQIASRNFTYQAQAQQMAMMGVQKALAQLNGATTNLETADNFVSQPGRVMVTRGTTTTTNELYSSNSGTPYIYLNEGQVIHTNIDKNFYQMPSIFVTNASGVTNGRYAYWVDDEGTKANLNAMSNSPRTNFYPYQLRSYDYSAVTNNGAANFGLAIVGSFPDSWAHFFTGNQMGLLLDANRIRADVVGIQHSTAGGLGNLTNLLPYTTTATFSNTHVSLHTNTNQDTTTFLTNIANPLTQIDSIISQKVDRAAISTAFGSTFTAKYGQGALRQIIANINDWPLGVTKTNGFTGYGSKDADGIPNQVLGLRRSIHLNEIATAVYYATNASEIQGQLFVGIELVNPYDTNWGAGAEVTLAMEALTFSGSYAYSNSQTASFTTASLPANTSYSFTEGVDIPDRSFSTNHAIVVTVAANVPPTHQPFSNVVISNVLVNLKVAKLLQASGQPDTICDWANTNDLPSWSWGANELTNSVSETTLSGAINSSNLPSYVVWTNAIGVAKNDPRVRTFSWNTGFAATNQAWQRVSYKTSQNVTMGSNNSVVDYSGDAGIGSILKDQNPGAGTAVWDHPSFRKAFLAETTNAPYRTVMDLGRVHTGLQWRTLWIRRTLPAEPRPPDWALLETFYLTNNLPKLNVNSIPFMRGTNSQVITNVTLQNNGMLRPRALSALLSGGSTNNAVAAEFDSLSGMTNISDVASNIATVNISSSTHPNKVWLSQRGFNTNDNAYFARLGEVLDIDIVSLFNTTNDFVNKGRPVAFIDSVSVASDVFMIYSVGQALAPGDSQNPVAEYRCKALVKYNNAEGKFEIITVEPMPLP